MTEISRLVGARTRYPLLTVFVFACGATIEEKCPLGAHLPWVPHNQPPPNPCPLFIPMVSLYPLPSTSHLSSLPSISASQTPTHFNRNEFFHPIILSLSRLYFDIFESILLPLFSAQYNIKCVRIKFAFN